MDCTDCEGVAMLAAEEKLVDIRIIDVMEGAGVEEVKNAGEKGRSPEVLDVLPRRLRCGSGSEAIRPPRTRGRHSS